MLDLQQLNCFVAVAQTQSIARAAERLHISQSPLSRQIIALEERLDLQLFARSGKRLKLNTAGQRLLVEATSLLAQATRLERSLRDEASGETRVLSVGYVESAVHAGVLPTALQALKRLRPQVRVQLHNLRSSAQIAALRAGEVDIAFTHSPPSHSDGMVYRRVVHEPFLLAIPSEHPLATVAAPTAAQLNGQAFVFVPQTASPVGHAALLAACQQAGFEPDICHEAAEPSVVLGLVAAGLGMAIVQSGLQRMAPPTVCLRPLPEQFTLMLEIYALLPTPASASAHALLDTCPTTSSHTSHHGLGAAPETASMPLAG